MEPVLHPIGCNVPGTSYRLRPGVVEKGRSNLVRVSVDPMSAFQSMNRVPFSKSDEARAPIQRSRFPVGTVIRKGFKAPAWDNDKAWSGLKKLDAKVVDIAMYRNRRHYYRLKWSGQILSLTLANVPRDVDEGYVQTHLLSEGNA